MIAVAMSFAGSRWSTMCAQSPGSVESRVVSGSVRVSVLGMPLVMRAIVPGRSTVDRPIVVAARRQRAFGTQPLEVAQVFAPLLGRPVVRDDHRAPRQHHAGDDEAEREPDRDAVR